MSLLLLLTVCTLLLFLLLLLLTSCRTRDKHTLDLLFVPQMAKLTIKTTSTLIYAAEFKRSRDPEAALLCTMRVIQKHIRCFQEYYDHTHTSCLSSVKTDGTFIRRGHVSEITWRCDIVTQCNTLWWIIVHYGGNDLIRLSWRYCGARKDSRGSKSNRGIQ